MKKLALLILLPLSLSAEMLSIAPGTTPYDIMQLAYSEFTKSNNPNPQVAATELANDYKNLQNSKGEVFASAYAIARIEGKTADQATAFAQTYTPAYQNAIDQGHSAEYSAAYAYNYQAASGGNTDPTYLHGYATAKAEGYDNEKAQTYATVYMTFLKDGMQETDAHTAASFMTDPATTDLYRNVYKSTFSIPFTNAYVTAIQQGHTEAYAENYAQAKVHGHSSYYASIYAESIGNGKSATYAQAYASMIEQNRDTDYANIYATMIENGNTQNQAQVYVDNYMKQISLGKTAVYAQAYAESIMQGTRDDWAMEYASSIANGHSREYASAYANAYANAYADAQSWQFQNPALYASAYMQALEEGYDTNFAELYAMRIHAGNTPEDAHSIAAAQVTSLANFGPNTSPPAANPLFIFNFNMINQSTGMTPNTSPTPSLTIPHSM